MPLDRARHIHQYREHFKLSTLQRPIEVGTATRLKAMSDESTIRDAPFNSMERTKVGGTRLVGS